MKKTIFALALLAFTGTATATFAQEANSTVKFEKTVYDFGNLTEGDDATAEFTFKNNGNEPVIIQNVRPACGCTTPYWSKEPIAPGKTGVVKASYGTQGRPGAFNKSITVTSTAGKEILYIKGTVKKAPTSSVPSNTSMIKK